MHLPKGLAIGGFRVVSSYKPGLTLAYAQAAVESEYTEAAARTLPPAVAEQLSRIMSPDWDTAQVMTVGPKFTTGDPKELIAMDFHRGLSQLAVTGALKADSPFVSSAISALISHMQSPGSAGPPLDFLEKAAPGLETEVAVAMKLSLQ